MLGEGKAGKLLLKGQTQRPTKLLGDQPEILNEENKTLRKPQKMRKTIIGTHVCMHHAPAIHMEVSE